MYICAMADYAVVIKNDVDRIYTIDLYVLMSKDLWDTEKANYRTKCMVK